MKAAIGSLLVVIALVWPRSAFGDDAKRCDSISIDADAHVRARWPDLLTRARVAFEDRTDIDACARVTLAHADKLRIEVTLPDGRVAVRSVTHVEDVVPVLEALLVVPAIEAPAPATNEAEPEPIVTPVTEHVHDTSSPPADRVVLPPTTRPTSKTRAAFELSALAGARMAGAPVSAGAGALAFADVNRWLVGLGARVDGYRVQARSTTVLELAALAGHRFRFSEVALDLVGGPAMILFQTGDRDANEVIALRGNGGPSLPPDESANVFPRLVSGARLHAGMRSTLRTFVGIDAALGMSGTRDDARRLPLATLGLSFGVTAATR